MRHFRTPFVVCAWISVAAVLLVTSALAESPDPCAGFGWDISQERSLFATSPLEITAGREPGTMPALQSDKLFRVHLAPQGDVNFQLPPSKKVPVENGYGGLAKLSVATAATYRIAGDSAFWIDVIAAGQVVQSRDYQGQKGCFAPHKIVEFELPAGVPIVLEISSAGSAEVRLSITRAPPP